MRHAKLPAEPRDWMWWALAGGWFAVLALTLCTAWVR